MTLTTLLRITLVFTLIVIILGAYTRLEDAGLGCPDWPGCYGQLTVPTQTGDIQQAQQLFPGLEVDQYKAWLEMIHRYVAGTLGLLVLWIGIRCWKDQDSPNKLPAAIAVLILFQAALGMWTVTMKLMPIVVMAHLLGGFTLLSLLLLLYLRTRPLRIPGGDAPARRLAPLAAIGLVILIAQIALGGWTSSNYAALACTALPLCEGDWSSNLTLIEAFSPFQGQHASFEYGVLDYPARMTIHVAHRIGAIITAAVLLYLALQLWRQARSRTLQRSAVILVLLLIVQLLLGISNIVLHLPLGIAVSHNVGAALLLLTMVFINYALWRKA
ncbi:cytochrome b561 [Shewanella sp. NFH-SH190041]|uniref:COX15/CtaA family protein n=1 Tax=Shewanella sp. NFH-SH190041 TaxID=2950245 RepID=UPI0021C2E946|nr:COX15/CtaA family protein [Shewanella sp. NFH-SH190041]BDM62869.1 cytochrome b561 [Shewanella sp. NFH-SH190041]